MNEALTLSPPGIIIRQLCLVMSDVDPIAKDKRNTSQNYSFRGIDDIYVALQAVLAKHQVVAIPTVLSERSEERTTKGGSSLIYRVLLVRYRFYAADMSYVDAVVVGEGMDSGDKASNKAMSVAQKYAMLQVFCIPTSEPKDPENDSPVVEPKRHPTVNVAPKPVAKPRPEPEQKVAPPNIYDGSPHMEKALHKAILGLKQPVPEKYWSKVEQAMRGREFKLPVLEQVANETMAFG